MYQTAHNYKYIYDKDDSFQVHDAVQLVTADRRFSAAHYFHRQDNDSSSTRSRKNEKSHVLRACR
jgi:hypothetical protein